MMTQNRCTSCCAVLPTDQTDRQGCLRCQQNARQSLDDLSGPDGLYAALSEALSPSVGSGGPRISYRAAEPSLGCDARVLDLMSPTTGVYPLLRAWSVDWHRLMDRQMPPAPTVDTLCRTLAFHLDWAAHEHPAWADFAWELGALVTRCEEATGHGAQPRPVVVGTCRETTDDGSECGGQLRFDRESVVTRCGACHRATPPDWRAIRAYVQDAA